MIVSPLAAPVTAWRSVQEPGRQLPPGVGSAVVVTVNVVALAAPAAINDMTPTTIATTRLRQTTRDMLLPFPRLPTPARQPYHRGLL